jgi:predicted nucleic acid-binding protein
VARILLATGGVISVQVLNEFTAVLRRKLKFSWKEVEEAVAAIRTLCPKVAALTVETYDKAFGIADRYGYQIHDSSIIAAALASKSLTLYSEDMNNGQVIDTLTIRDPFTKHPDC